MGGCIGLRFRTALLGLRRRVFALLSLFLRRLLLLLILLFVEQLLNETPVVLGIGVIGLQGQSLIVGSDRVFELTRTRQCITEVVLSACGVHALQGVYSPGVIAFAIQRRTLPLGVFKPFGGFGVIARLESVGPLLVGGAEPIRHARLSGRPA